MDRTRSSPRQPLLFGVIALWVGTLFGGVGVLGTYATQDGDAGPTPPRWPDEPRLAPATHEQQAWTVLLAAHPKCPCTRASITELTQSLADATEPYRLVVLAYEPGDQPGFATTPTLDRLNRVGHTTVVTDMDGQIARRFGALTSGFVAVYDPRGDLRFAGGVTPTRSHTGPNTGSAALRALLTGRTPPASSAPVFGCPIQTNAIDPDPRGSPLGACLPDGAPACQP